MKTLPSQLKKNLAPLLLALAVSQAYAIEVVVVGDGGIDGVSGAALGQWGTAGTSATASEGAASRALPGSLQLVLYGGRGGDGGNGGGLNDTTFAGHGAAGGHGAAASGRASAVAAALDVTVQASVFGGGGGRGGSAGGVNSEHEWEMTDGETYLPALGMSGVAGNGGAALSAATGASAGGGNVDVKAVARGGSGGDVEGQAGRAGMGGGAAASAVGRSDSGRVSVAAEAYGGHGGAGDPRRGAAGGSGADITLVDAVSGRTSGVLVLAQHAEGGAAGGGRFLAADGPGAGDEPRQFAGNAVSQLSVSDADASAVSAGVSARGGGGGASRRSDLASDTGGTAWAALTLASTRQGAALDGWARADGGQGGPLGNVSGSGSGGRADARAELTGLGDVRGAAVAYGGSGRESLFGGTGGDARAVLMISAAGLATGDAYAAGGGTGAESGYYQPAPGEAEVHVELVGAGARGTASADGRSVVVRLDARTTGALPVEMTASAGKSGAASVAVNVQSGVGAASAGSAPVSARAYAEAPGGWNYWDTSPSMSAAIDVAASGDIDGASRASSGDIQAEYGTIGYVGTRARGVTSGAHSVVLSAVSRAGANLWTAPAWWGGFANASVYGQSGSGSVNVTAEAHAGRNTRVEFGDTPQAVASATAVNLAPGGHGVARATAWGGNADARASAAGIGAGGTALRVAGGAGTVLRPEYEATQLTMASGALASNRFDAAGFALPAAQTGGAFALTRVSAAPATVGEIAGLGPAVAAALHSAAGVGMHALSYDTPQETRWGSYVDQTMLASGEFEFDAVGGQHLLIGFVSGTFSGSFGWLELSITNNGIGLFSRAFSSADDALVFFNDNVLDLGLMGAGRQDVLVSSHYLFADPARYSFNPGALAFNYVVGAGSGLGVSPVPEASSWLMLVAGLGCVLLVARRRRPAARAA